MTQTTAANTPASRRLLEFENELRERSRAIRADLAQRPNPDSEDRASELENEEALLALERETSAELAQVQAALNRLNEGKYELCERCGQLISAERHAAIPETTVCVGCAD